MCFECVRYESLWWLACLCLHDMKKTPGEQRCLDLFREEVLLSAVQQLWRNPYSLLLCNSRSRIPIKSSHKNRLIEWEITLLYITNTLLYECSLPIWIHVIISLVSILVYSKLKSNCLLHCWAISAIQRRVIPQCMFYFLLFLLFIKDSFTNKTATLIAVVWF